jgi:protein-tyrosine phosphatase
MPQTVLFLCTGNYYRSRFAEILFNTAAARQGLAWQAESRGLALELGVNNVGPLSAHAIQRLNQLGIPFEAYLRMPRQAEEVELEQARLVIALDGDEHRPMLLARHPHQVERVEYWNIRDLQDASPAEALPQLERAIRDLIHRLMQLEPTPAASSTR